MAGHDSVNDPLPLIPAQAGIQTFFNDARVTQTCNDV